MQDQVLKENQLLVKEIALKYTTDSDSWNRQKQKLLEKEKLVSFGKTEIKARLWNQYSYFILF